MGLKQYLQKRAEELEKNNSGRGGWHSSFYQSYFEGYTEFYVTAPNGKRKLERIYTGVYYSSVLTKTRRLLVCLLYVVLFTLAVTAFFFGANGAGGAWYLVVCVAGTVLFSFMLLWALFHYVIAPCEMTRYEFLRASNIKRYSAGSAVFLFCTVVATLVSALQNAPASIPWIHIAELGVSGLCMTGISVIERNIQYNKRLSKNKVPQGGVEIGDPDSDH